MITGDTENKIRIPKTIYKDRQRFNEGFVETCECGEFIVRKYNILGFSFGKILGCERKECENYYEKRN